jgi:hypothetical protein
MALEEYEITKSGNFRPPRDAKKGGMTRAANAGQQATTAGILSGATSGQMNSAMAPGMASLIANLGNQKKLSDIAATMTEVRRQGAIDAASDFEQRLQQTEDANKPRWDEYATKGIAGLTLLSDVAGAVKEGGTSEVTVKVPLMVPGTTEQALDATGKPIMVDRITTKKSGLADAAGGLQGFIGKILPSVGAQNKAHDEALASSIEEKNMLYEGGGLNVYKAAQQEQSYKEQRESTERFKSALDSIFSLFPTAEIEKLRKLSEESSGLVNGSTPMDYTSPMVVDDKAVRSKVVATRISDDPAQFASLFPYKLTRRALGPDGVPMFRETDESFAAFVEEPMSDKVHYGVSREAADPVLSLVSRGEGNYNSFNRGTAGDSVRIKASDKFGSDLTKMTVGQIMELQSGSGGEGGTRKLFAAGRYQIIPSTMKQMMNDPASGISPSELFSPETQDKMMMYLMSEKRPEVFEYVNSDRHDPALLRLAARGMAKEFASVADPDSGLSRYGGVGGNKASISVAEIYKALREMRARNIGDRVKGGTI